MAQEEKKEAGGDKNIIELANKEKTAVVKIYVFGATVTNWIVDGEEQLFVSSEAKLDKSKAIRGGIPLVFPQFGPGPMKQHGFARVCEWKYEKEKASQNAAILTLSDSELSDEWKQQFPYSFCLQYTVKVSDDKSLFTELSITNKEKDKSFDFTTLFHTYFAVNSKGIKVLGLKDLSYSDKLEPKKDEQIKKEENTEVGIACEVDRIYMDIGDKDIVLVDESKKKYQKITIQRTNFVDVVLWNPWIEKAKRMGDFDDSEYENMVCIEPGSVAKPVTLKAGDCTKYTQTLIASAL